IFSASDWASIAEGKASQHNAPARISRKNFPIFFSSDDWVVAGVWLGRRLRSHLEPKFLQDRSLQHCGSSENKPCQQIDRVVTRSVPPSAVVVRLSAIETQIACVLQHQVAVLRRPPGSV